jgi:hypothetical protein
MRASTIANGREDRPTPGRSDATNAGAVMSGRGVPSARDVDNGEESRPNWILISVLAAGVIAALALAIWIFLRYSRTRRSH